MVPNMRSLSNFIHRTLKSFFNKIPMKELCRSILIIMILLLNSCVNLTPLTPDDYATKFVDAEIKNCGKVKPDESIEKVQDCIFEGLEQNVPFYAWFWLRPKDSLPASGIILNDKSELFIAWYDSYIHGSKRTYFSISKCNEWGIDGFGRNKKVLCKVPQNQNIYPFRMNEFTVIQKIER